MICRNHGDVAEGVRACSRCGDPFCADCLVSIQGQPFCAACKTERLLDVRSGTDRMRVVIAGFWIRFGAQVMDWLICFVPAYMIWAVVMQYMMQNNKPSVFLLAWLPFFVLPLLYEGLMLTLKNGQTVGKMAMRLRVVRPDGSRISAVQAWGRAIVRTLFGCIFIVDLVPFFFTDQKTTLHDLLTGTRVAALT